MSDPDYDFLSQEAPDEQLPEVAAVEEVAEKVDTPEPPAAEVTTTPEQQEERVPLAALKEERRKRQEYEARLRQYEQQAQQQQAPSFQDDPGQFVEMRLAQRTFAMSEAMAREMYADYDEVIEEFVQYAQDKPYLQAELTASAHPASFAYKQGKALRERKEMEDLPAYRAKLEAEIRAKVDAELKAKDEARLKAANAIPPDLTAARASKTEEVVPDDSLDSILQSRKSR